MEVNLFEKIPQEPAARWLFIGTRVLVAGVLAVLISTLGGRNDLDIYVAASHSLWEGENVYLRKFIDGYSFFYSPLFAIAVSPFAYVPPWFAKLIWGSITLLLYGRCVSIIYKEYLPKELSSNQSTAILFFSFLFLFQAIRDNLNSSQVTVLMLWLCLESIRCISNKQVLLGALLLALGIDMKLIPMVLLPYLVYRDQWKAALLTVALVALIQLVPAVFIGWQHNADLLHTRWELLRPTDARHVLDEDETSFFALGSLLSAYFSADGGGQYTLDLPRTVIALDLETIAKLLLIGRLVFIVGSLRFLRWPPLKSALSPLHVWWELGYLLLCTILIFPHQRYYSMFMAMPAALWLVQFAVVRWRKEHGRGRIWLALWVLVYLLSNIDLLLGEFAAVYEHYKVMSFAVIALIGMLWWCSPDRLTKMLDAKRAESL